MSLLNMCNQDDEDGKPKPAERYGINKKKYRGPTPHPGSLKRHCSTKDLDVELILKKQLSKTFG